jgi:hypothetical protein
VRTALAGIDHCSRPKRKRAGAQGPGP